MRLPILTSFILLFVLVPVSVAQTKVADSDPVMKGSFTFSLPQSSIDAEIDGNVFMTIRVDETGKVITASLAAGPMWPCSAKPEAALKELSLSLSDTIKNLRFTPALKDGKAITKQISLKVALKNPKLAPVININALTGKHVPRQISGGVLNGIAKEFPIPAYPSDAKAEGDQGIVTIEVLIDEEGTVTRAGAIHGAVALHKAARDAACRAKFLPSVLSGIPVKVTGVLQYNFQLKDRGVPPRLFPPGIKPVPIGPGPYSAGSQITSRDGMNASAR